MTHQFFGKPWIYSFSLFVVIGSIGISACASPSHISSNSQQSAVVAELPPEALQVVSFRSPTCGCCAGWVEHMRNQGFQVEDNVVEDMEAIKREHNIPTDLASCHTAIVNGYIVEGHIPAADVQRLLTEQPDVAGIAVPGMPIGSPGMESGDMRQPYAVYTFTEDGAVEVFQEHSS
jgi:hypothetical protein